eukprot:2887588-Amphidinium_carterae.1
MGKQPPALRLARLPHWPARLTLTVARSPRCYLESGSERQGAIEKGDGTWRIIHDGVQVHLYIRLVEQVDLLTAGE